MVQQVLLCKITYYGLWEIKFDCVAVSRYDIVSHLN